MELKTAIGILETHNRWRRGEDIEPELKPRDIGIAIDIVTKYLKKNEISDGIIVCEHKQHWRIPQVDGTILKVCCKCDEELGLLE